MTVEKIGEESPLSWEEFKKLAKENELIAKEQRAKAENKAEYSDWIYRGHSCAKWKLETTLERFLEKELDNKNKNLKVREYYQYLNQIIPAINANTSYKFSFINFEELGSLKRSSKLPHYELLCLTRHLGFPSPLLDWTESYYIAAFFAFRNADKCKNVAIYSYKEWNGNARGGWVGEPMMNEHGPYVETHPRHYKQQSHYTPCIKTIDDTLYFTNPEEAANDESGSHNLKKYYLQGTQKDEVLSDLFSMNINDYTLFGDEESLMRMLAFKEIKLPNID
ncbi:MAG: FRG domain-containing protein [Micavibrio sp.]